MCVCVCLGRWVITFLSIGSPICPGWALKSLLFQLTSRRNSFAPQISSPFSSSHTTRLGKGPNRSLLKLRQRELGPPYRHVLPLPRPGRGGGGGHGKLVGWEALGSKGSVPSYLSLPLFPSPIAQGYPASSLSLATGPRPLPTSCCGIHLLRGFPHGPLPMGCKLRHLKRLLSIP